VLYLLCIVQEMVTTCFHATRTGVNTDTEVDGRHVFIRPRDYGTDILGESRYHGLTSLRRRPGSICGAAKIQPAVRGRGLNC
jgi:hypothetical protein